VKQSILDETFPLFHEFHGKKYPRSSGIIKLHPHSLHQIVHFGGKDDKFLEHVRLTSIEGDHVHDAVRSKICALMANGRMIHSDTVSPVDDEPYSDPLTAMEQLKTNRCIQWLLNQNMEIILPPEKTIVSASLEYGGSPDLVCTIDGVPMIIDFKTGHKYQAPHWLQLESYAQLLEEERDIRIEQIGTLLLGAETTKSGVKFSRRPPSTARENHFMHLLECWNTMFPEPFDPAPEEDFELEKAA
jgi:hypothetical protein